jgi:protein required for attachment to host cells
VEDTDWHRLAEDRFAVETADALYRLAPRAEPVAQSQNPIHPE